MAAAEQNIRPEFAARERFERDTAEHQLTVLRDDGLYRHLRFRAPGTICYGFDLITWPGYLAIVGDVESHVFARIEDMFGFFRRAGMEGINPHYWSEKLQAADTRGKVRVFAPELYRRRVERWFEDRDEEGAERTLLKAAIHEQLLPHGQDPFDEREALDRLHAFEHHGVTIDEPYEWTLTEFSAHFLWCCWAIVWGIEQYEDSRQDTPARGRSGIAGAAAAGGEAVRLLERLLSGIFGDWRTVPDANMTDDERDARGLLLRLGQ